MGATVTMPVGNSSAFGVGGSEPDFPLDGAEVRVRGGMKDGTIQVKEVAVGLGDGAW